MASKVREKRTPLAVILVMSILIVGLVYGFFIRPNYHLVNGGTIYLNAIYAGKLDADKGAKMTTMDDMLYVATREGLTKMSINGDSIWNKSYHFNELLFLEASPYLAVVDITGKEAFIFDEKEGGEVARIQTDYIIVSASLNKTGYLTLVTEDNDENYISMYKDDGEIVVRRRTVFKEDGYPVDVTMSDDGTKMMTSHLYVSQHVIESDITFLDYSTAGEAFSDRVVAHERIKETMASKLHYIDNNHSVVVGDNLLRFYKTDLVPEVIKEISVLAKIKDYIITDDALVISYGESLVPEGKTVSNRVISYSNMGEVVVNLGFEERVTNMASGDETFYVIQSSHISKYKEGELVWETSLHKDVDKIYGLTGNRFLVVYPYDYEILEIDDI